MEVRIDLTEQQYRDAFRALSVDRNLRLVEVCGYEVNSQARFSAIWEPGHGAYSASAQWTQHMIRAADFQRVFDERKVLGYRPVRINGYNVAGETFFAAIWEKADGPSWACRHDFHILNLAEHLRQVRLQGYRVADIGCYRNLEPNPEVPPPAPLTYITRFSSIWVESDGRDWDVVGPSRVYQSDFDRQVQLGRFPVRVSGYTPGNTDEFVALFEKAPGMPAEAGHGKDTVHYEADRLRLTNAGWRPIATGAYSAGRGSGAVPRFNPIWEQRNAASVVPGLAATFLRDFDIPGMALAVAKNGRLVYMASSGVANKASGTPASPANLFRIASISKPITSVAVLRLAAEGRVDLQHLVFGPNGYLSALGTPTDPQVENIVVRQLLEHSSGGWPNDANDPMYTNYGLSARELISWVLKNRSLSNAPGTKYAYSNFGYCVLGRVIEQVTGQTYEEYVRQNVLLPCGAQAMFIAGDTEAEKHRYEVTYYGPDGLDPYGIRVSRMDAHGGWLANVSDLLRFAVHVDGFAAPADILSSEYITLMTTPSGLAGSDGYALGWYVGSDGTWSHSGWLAGTTSVLSRTADGYCWAALANSGRRNATDGLSDLMWKIHDRVDIWPENTQL
ncbi:serine hydrolase [Streptomyces sp. NPDC002004]